MIQPAWRDCNSDRVRCASTHHQLVGHLTHAHKAQTGAVYAYGMVQLHACLRCAARPASYKLRACLPGRRWDDGQGVPIVPPACDTLNHHGAYPLFGARSSTCTTPRPCKALSRIRNCVKWRRPFRAASFRPHQGAFLNRCSHRPVSLPRLAQVCCTWRRGWAGTYRAFRTRRCTPSYSTAPSTSACSLQDKTVAGLVYAAKPVSEEGGLLHTAMHVQRPSYMCMKPVSEEGGLLHTAVHVQRPSYMCMHA